ncbi:ABC transporter ATP-binding protein [Devosia riboflavina]|uniref:ABC transporter ATP-binding protein n=1 Tax=Devosia riboflavina TaxID=46914 RepID=UPI00068D8404|nr:ABC transporter ATP-binding protein [Devosia riboflavina]
MTVLRIANLGKTYGTATALAGVSLDVAMGSRTVIVGPSGSGKTTLLRLIAGFEAPDTGRIELNGELLADAEAGVPAYRRNIGLVMQEGALFPHLSVLDNICFGIRSEADANKRALALMDMTELDRGMAQRQPHQLSGGQQQRVALARALARQPRLMLLDEPFSALDAGLREQMRDATANILAQAGVATVLVTHDRDEAMGFADQLVILRDGRLVQAGSPKSLYRRPVDATTAAFLGAAIILPADFSVRTAECALGALLVPETDAAEGAGKVLIRPEQLNIVAAPEGEWHVVSALDRGNKSAVTIERVYRGDRVVISFDDVSVHGLEVGQAVQVEIAGTVRPLKG